jgi:hypothetical protein
VDLFVEDDDKVVCREGDAADMWCDSRLSSARLRPLLLLLMWCELLVSFSEVEEADLL